MTAHVLLSISQAVAGPAPQPAGAGPNALLADGWPARILAAYWPIWEAFRFPITSIPSSFNVIHIFNGRFNTDGSVNLPLNPGDLSIAQLQTCVNRGQRIILTMGGAGLAFDFANRTQTTNFVNSVQTLINTTLGGLVTGLDWNNYEQASSINVTEMIWASQQLQLVYGPTFAITSPPGGFNTGGTAVNGIAPGSALDLNSLGSMKDAGVLTWAAGQYYDDANYKTANTVKILNDRWAARLGDTSTVIAFSANYNFTNALTLAECEREWDAAVAAHPTLRGMACWNGFTDVTTLVDASENSMGAASGNNQWGAAMRSRLDSLYPAAPPPPPPVNVSSLQGVNLSSFENALSGVKTSPSTLVNLDFTVPRAQDLTFLASQGFGQHRLCLLWELCQPILASAPANATVLAAYGISAAGKMQPKIMGWILDVLDAAAAAGVKILLDLHNYCRFQDYVYQVDGSVTGFNAGNSLSFPYTTNSAQVITRIMALAAGTTTHPTITQSDYNAFWTNFVSYVEAGTGRHINGHPGVAAYGLMNEPHDMPAAGGNTAGGFPEDLTIWNTFAQGAINAIRAIDSTTPIFVSGNDFEIPWTGNPGGSYLGNNPLYPLTGTNLTYEAHFYLDAFDNGADFDWTIEAARAISDGESGSHGITTSTGAIRAQYAVDFITSTGKPMVVSELGMPVNDVRWQQSMEGALGLLFSHGIGHHLWVGGNHWSFHGFSLSGIPDFKQGLTLIPLPYGPMHKAAVRTMFNVFADSDTNWGPAGTVCTTTVYTRGYSPSAVVVTLTKASTGVVTTVSGTSGASTIVVGSATGLAVGASVSGTGIAAGATITALAGTTATLSAPNTATVSGNGTFTGTLSASSVTIPAGANQSATFTYTTVGTEDATVTFGGVTVLPAQRHFYSMDPATYAATDKTVAGRAALAKFNALEYLPANSFTDYLNGTRAVAGQKVRAIYNSAFGESFFVAHGMKIWINDALGAGGPVTLPAFGLDTAGKPRINFTNNFGLWNKKIKANDGVSDPNPVSVLPYKASDNHFYIVGLAIAGATGDGTVFAANYEQGSTKTELDMVGGKPKLTMVNAAGVSNSVTAPAGLTTGAFHTVGVRSIPGSQVLRVDKTTVATLALTPSPDPYTSMSLGFIFDNFFPFPGFTGSFYGAVTGKGNPTDAEMSVMADYLSLVATGAAFGAAPADYPAGVSGLSAWFDPATFSSLSQSSVSGGAVTAVGQSVGQVNSRSPGTAVATCADAVRAVLAADAGGFDYLNGIEILQTTVGGGSTTGFFFIAALKLGTPTNGFLEVLWNDDTGDVAGYRISYLPGSDRMTFHAGNGTAATTVTDTTVLSGASGVPFVVMAWDDGTNLNIQVNNGTVTSAARPTVQAGASNPFIWVADGANDGQMNARFYGMIQAKNNGLSPTDRAGIKTWLGAKIGLVL